MTSAIATIYYSPTIALDLFPLLTMVLASVVCGLLGNFLVLRRLSLMGDAISHSVLPGLVAAFVIAGSRSPAAMLIGATVAGAITVMLVEVVKRLGRVESGAAMGVVFSVMFALGVFLMERGGVAGVHLDANCLLYGQAETLAWFGAPEDMAGLWSIETLRAVPMELGVLTGVTAASALFVVLLFKELRIAAFDSQLSSSLGFNAGAMHHALMVLVAAATVASFFAVGSILVIAMLICPAATARLLTDRLRTQIVLSLVIALAASVAGYVGSALVPALFNLEALNAAGSVTAVLGAGLVGAMLFGPSHGILARWLRRRSLAARVAVDDLLALLYRRAEAGTGPLPEAAVAAALPRQPARSAIRTAVRTALVDVRSGHIGLTRTGVAAAERVISRHRLWESYLVEQAGVAPDHVHPTAEQLEHLDPSPAAGPTVDPHGRAIPKPEQR